MNLRSALVLSAAMILASSVAQATFIPPPPPITPVVSGSAEASHVFKASAGNLYNVYAQNFTATAGFLVVINATTAPTTGSAITPLDCIALPSSGFASLSYASGSVEIFSTGITVLLTSAANCFTFTSGTITGYIHGQYQ